MPFDALRRHVRGSARTLTVRLSGTVLLLVLLVAASGTSDEHGAAVLGWASPLLLGGWLTLGRERRARRRGWVAALFIVALLGEAALARVGALTLTPSVAAAAAGLAIALGNPRQGIAQSLQRVAGALQLALAGLGFGLLLNGEPAPLTPVAATAHLLLGGYWLLRPGADVAGQRIARCCAALMIAVGAIGVIGWSVDDAVLVQAGTAAVPMQFNTSGALLLVGIALMLLSAGQRRAALMLQLPAVTLALLTLLEEYFGVATGLGEALVAHGVVAEAVPPGRTAPNTAAALLLGALGLLLSPRRLPATPARWAATWAAGFIVAAIGSIVLIGYLIGAPPLRAFGLQTPMALWTGLAMAAYGLGLGFVGSRPKQSGWLAGWAPLLVALGTVATALLAWQALTAERERAAGVLLSEQAGKVRMVIDAGYALRIGAVQRMAERLASAGEPDDSPARRFVLDSAAYLRDFPQLTGLVRVGADGTVLQVASDRFDLRGLLGRDDRASPERRLLYAEALQGRRPVLSGELALAPGRRGQLLVVPMLHGDTLVGYLTVGLDHRALLETLLRDAMSPAPLRLSLDGQPLVAWQRIDGPPPHREHFDAGGLRLTLELGAPAGSADGTRLATSLLMVGLLTAGLLALALRMTGLARDRARSAEQASRALQQQVAERERAEAALTRSQREIVEVFESISDAVLMLDRDWRLVYVNPHAEALLRTPRDRLLGRTFWEVLPDTESTFRPIYERALCDQAPLAMQELYAPLKSWFDIRIYPHANGLAIYFRDITTEKLQQLQLERSDALLKIAGSSARIGGWAIDLASDRMQWTDEICAIHQLPVGSAPNLSEALAYYVPEHRERVRAAFNRCCVDGLPWDEEFELITDAGRRLWVRSIGLARRDVDGQVIGAHGALQDISERKRQELQLRQVVDERGAALESLRQVMNSAVDIIAVIDADGRFTLTNTATEAIWGCRADDLIGESCERLVHPDDIAMTRAVLARVMAGEPVVDFRNRNVTPDGRTVQMQWSACWSASARRMYCIGRDRSAEHRIEQFEAGQRDILVRIAGGEPLRDSLDALLRLYETQYPGALCAVMLVEPGGRQLHICAAPSFPPALLDALDGVPIGAASGACGTSVHRGERVVIADIANSPLCDGYHELAVAHGLRACWASPVRSSGGQVLATFAVYYADIGEPAADELHAMDGIVAVTAVAVEHAASTERVIANSTRLQRLASATVALNSSIGLHTLYQQLVDQLRELVGAHMAVLSLSDGDRWDQAMVAVSLSDRHARWRGFDAVPSGAGIYREVMRQRRSLRLSQAELEAHPAFRHFSGLPQHPPLRGLLAVPLIGSDGDVLGVLQLSDRHRGDFDDDDQAIAQQFAQLAATALERSQLIERLRERDRFFEMSVELFCVFDPARQRFLQVNPAFVQLLGYTEQELTEQSFLDFIHADDREVARRATARMQDAHDELVGFTIRYVAADGGICWLEWAGSCDRNGRYYMVARNITERRRIELERDHAEAHDPQTGLPRYAVLEVRLADMLDRGMDPVVFYIDIDRLHGINESMGHAVGDEALLRAAERLRRAIGEPDRLARFAGDEFVAALPGLDRDAALAFAETLRQAVAEPVEGDGYRVYLTASIGIARAPIHGESARELLRRAEAAMTQAKQQGRDSVCEFSAERMQLLEDRRVLGSRLRDAIDAGELSLSYQPRIRAIDRRVIGFEALARWNSAELGPVPPDRFVPTAEALGLMPELGRWVLQQACRQIRLWLDLGHRDFSVAVNVSAHQLQRPEMVDQVRDALAAERIPPHMLDLELTESSLMENVERVQTKLAELKQLGVSLSLDDFGTGYSSLAYLKQFSLDKLKIDRRFVRDLPHGAHDVAIARTIVAMAHQLKMEVSAEGVEDEAQASFLRDIGCDELQGYWFGRPLPPAQAGELFHRD